MLEPQFLFPLNVSQVHLVPQSLARKRLWNKKYPICVELAKQDDFMSKAEGEKPEAAETGAAQDRGSAPSSRDVTLYLFGRTGREKEEWFQRLLAASRLKLDSRKASRAAAAKSGEQSRRFPHTHVLQTVAIPRHKWKSEGLAPQKRKSFLTCCTIFALTHSSDVSQSQEQPQQSG